jgi:SPP1 gp7 family putative phage head morphogenesis protein
MAGANLLGRLHIVRVGVSKTRRPVQLATGSRLVRNFAEQSDNGTFDVGFSMDVPSQGGIDYLRHLTPVTRHVFDGLTRQYQNDAFTIAGVNDQRVITKVRDALADTMAQGGTAADFKPIVHKITSDAGVADLASFELDTVFYTNTAKAYSTGRLEQMNEPHMLDALPFWQYWTVGDMRVRPAHAALDQFCARAIDPVWRRIYPPWGFNCRCSVVPILAEEAPKGSEEGGFERLPMLTRIELGQTDFRTPMAS